MLCYLSLLSYPKSTTETQTMKLICYSFERVAACHTDLPSCYSSQRHSNKKWETLGFYYFINKVLILRGKCKAKRFRQCTKVSLYLIINYF